MKRSLGEGSGAARLEQFQLCQQHIRLLQDQTGIPLEATLETRESAESLATHSRWEVKYAALFMLASYWGTSRSIADICETIISSNADKRLREQAIICLYSHYSGAKDCAKASLLCKLALDETQDQELRAIAYYGVLRILKPSTDVRLPHEAILSFPNDFDSDLVRKVLNSRCS